MSDTADLDRAADLLGLQKLYDSSRDLHSDDLVSMDRSAHAYDLVASRSFELMNRNGILASIRKITDV